MAAALQGDLAPALDSMRQMQKLFGSTWRMDNPLVNFGLAPYQPGEDINLTVDNFASPGAPLPITCTPSLVTPRGDPRDQPLSSPLNAVAVILTL